MGVGAAVGVNVGVLSNSALVGESARLTVNGLTVKANIPVGKENHFETTATSGAGASDVGVAGSLGVNTLVSTTTAVINGNGATGADVDAGAGNILIEAGNASTSTVTAAADVKGTDAAAKVGIGASVGVNVVSNKTLGPFLWDADSVLRGNAKELIDSLTALGWFHDDSPKWIVAVDGRQDASRREIGPMVEVEVRCE